MATTKKPAKSAPKKAAASKTTTTPKVATKATKAPKAAKKEIIETPAEVIAVEVKTPIAKAPAKRKKKIEEPLEAEPVKVVAVPVAAKPADESDDEEEQEEDDDNFDDEEEDDEEDEEDDEEDDEESEDDEDAEEDEEGSDEEDADPEFVPKPRPPANLVRLQKILAAAGVASRRRAEELIEQGRVQVNGKLVTELGTKADAGRDHIRVDGKLLQGAERLRYYVLNKPKGFVTTVKDPEGRPTVMQFFEKMKERLYPVGRLDYMSEGLLLVTNDGELANRLTKASSGVEKTYLVKVAGQPTEEELDILRGGVSIPRGKVGTDRVKTAPARIRQVRQGDNPWFELVLIEGRNRELRKMFEEIGHFVEKIRRIGYGPLVLDQEPGNLRELDEQELSLLRLAAEGKLRTAKSKDMRRRNLMDSQILPTLKPRASFPAASQPFDEERPARPSGQGYRPASDRPNDRSRRPAASGPSRFSNDRDRNSVGRPAGRPAWQKDAPSFRPAEGGDSRPSAGRTFGDRPAPARTFGDRPVRPFGDRPSRPFGDKPEGSRPSAGRPDGDAPRSFGDRPKPFGDRPAKPFGDRPAGRSFGDRPKPFGDRPERKTFGKPAGDEKWGKRNVVPQRADDNYDDLEPRKPVKIFIEPVANEERSSSPRSTGSGPYQGRSSAPRSFDRPQSGGPRPARPDFNRGGSDRAGSDRPRPERPDSDRPARPSFNKPSYGRPGFSKPSGDRPGSDRPGRPSFDRPRPEGGGSDRPASPRPFRSEGGLERRYTTSSGVPRAGGARPNNKSGKEGGGKSYGGSNSRPSYGSRPSTGRPAFRRTEGEGTGARPARPFTPRAEGSSDFRPSTPKPYSNSAPRTDRNAGGTWKPKPSGGARPGGFSKPGGFKGGSRPSGGRPGGAPGGKKRY